MCRFFLGESVPKIRGQPTFRNLTEKSRSGLKRFGPNFGARIADRNDLVLSQVYLKGKNILKCYKIIKSLIILDDKTAADKLLNSKQQNERGGGRERERENKSWTKSIKLI